MRIGQFTNTKAIPMSASEALQFIKSIYLGDRACKGFRLDSHNHEFRIFVDEISRVRSVDGAWNFYNEENLEDACIVFAQVETVRVKMTGPMPNDYVELLGVQEAKGRLEFQVELGCVGADGLTVPETIEIIAGDIYLESAEQPGVKIR